jgi:regulation of enolase protein 1 (concanavalin A-like superfamily)
MKWYNEPPVWNEQDQVISVTSGLKTDFWRKTHYGFIRDTGHFYYQEMTSDFIAEVKITGQYQVLYDQAGLMVRENDLTWLKCGIEFVDSLQYASTVVTRDYSDWSVVALPENPTSLWLKLKREGGAVEVKYSLDGEQFRMMRFAYLTEAKTVQVGLMCASPEREGFQVSFENFQIKTLSD